MTGSRRLRICLATDSLEPSGVGEHMLALASELREDFAIALTCPPSEGGAALLTRAARLGIGVEPTADDPIATRDWIAANDFDLLHVHAGIAWEGHGLVRLGREAGVARIVRTEHLPDLITDADQRRDHVEGIALVDRVICVSASTAATFRATAGDANRLVVVGNGFPTRAPSHDRATMRRRFGVDDVAPVLLTVARFTPQKDHATLLDALPAVLARHPDTQLWLVGTGALETTVRDQAAAMGLDATVRFLGHRDDVPDLLEAADLFVLPSRFEGMPLAVLEAMAAGRAVVATAVGGTDEAVVDGVTGRLVPPGDAALLADAIVEVLMPGRARELGAAGRTRHAASFTAARMAAETAAVYRSLALGRPGGNR